MEFEDLQAIWDTQNDKPVFAMQDARLLVALYQQRERSRQRAFRLHFAPMYVAALAMLRKVAIKDQRAASIASAATYMGAKCILKARCLERSRC